MRIHRNLSIVVLAVLAGFLVPTPGPASAAALQELVHAYAESLDGQAAPASIPLGNWQALQTAAGNCDGTAESPTVVELSDDVNGRSEADPVLTVNCVLMLDLAGFELLLERVVIDEGQLLNIADTAAVDGSLETVDDLGQEPGIDVTGAVLIVDGGNVTAMGGLFGAGIGGDFSGDIGEIVINGGAVNASGGGAGIGGGEGGDGGNITINGGTITTINDGTVVRSGGGAGIGGGEGGDGGNITINGGTITTIGADAAAIGGGRGNGHGGNISINGGTITATSENAAAIGGGNFGDGGTVTIDGGNVTATAEGGGAGIGGGWVGAGGVIEIGNGAEVTASGHTAIGMGSLVESSEKVDFGSLLVEGTLWLPDGQLIVPDTAEGAEVTIGETGEILGTEEDPTTGGMIVGPTDVEADGEPVGPGEIDNGGVIALTADLVIAETDPVTVTDHHYPVSFDTGGGTPVPVEAAVFAPTFDAGHRAFPDDPTRGADLFKGWTTGPDGTGELVVDGSSVLPGTATTDAPGAMTLHAWWAADPAVVTDLPGDATTITAGTATQFTATVVDEHGDPYPHDPADLTITEARGAVDAEIAPATGAVTITSTVAGVHELVLTAPTGDGDATGTVTITVEAADVADLTLLVSATTVEARGSITIEATGTDEFGNTTGDETGQTSFSSDVPTDEIDGNTITFPTASTHTITATHADGLTDTIAVTVNPPGSAGAGNDAAGGTDGSAGDSDSCSPPSGTGATDTVATAPASADPEALAATGLSAPWLLVLAIVAFCTGSLATGFALRLRRGERSQLG